MAIGRRIFLAGLASATLAASAALGQVQDISGTYQVDGMNADGSRYSGSVTVDVRPDAGVSVQWSIGTSVYSGTGLIEGRVLAVDWGGDTPAVYVIMPFGELHGTWDGGRALERWHGK